MRLIHTKTFELREFVLDVSRIEFPRYAILSHTWGEQEVTFQDFQDLEQAQKKAGFNKILQCCDQAWKDGLEWAWVDTCCIDKSSSAELSEAINSMFKWYEASSVCYAYISDFDSAFPYPDMENLRYARWFSRGWTLQELVAPVDVVFYDMNWNELGTKASMAGSLAKWTLIPIGVLENTISHLSIPVIRRMAWAHTRVTTRIEDTAYCLLGIFDINMPLLYGEGDRAFTRLQAEILRATNDGTIFLGSLNYLSCEPEHVFLDALSELRWQNRILANPTTYSNDIDAFPDPEAHRTEPPTITGSKLLINLPLRQIAHPSYHHSVYYGAINCLDQSGSRCLVRYFRAKKDRVNTSIEPFHLETCDFFWWVPKVEVNRWHVERCVISLGGHAPTAQTLHPFREPGSRNPWALYQACSMCGQSEYGWTWVSCSYLPQMTMQAKSSVYLLKLERPAKVVFISLMFIAPSVREPGKYCRIGLERLPTKEKNGGEAGLEAILLLQEGWKSVVTEGLVLLGGQTPNGLKGVWSKPLIEGRGPIAQASIRVPVCSGTAEMVATLTCRESWHRIKTYIPELRFQRFKPGFEPE